MAKKRSRSNGDGDVFPRKNNVGEITSYRGAYVAPDGKRRYVSGKTKTEAREALSKARAAAAGGLFFDSGNITVGEYLDRWLRDSVRGSVKPTTYDSYESLVRVHVKPRVGRVKLKNLTPAHLSALYRDRLDSGLSSRTVQYIHVVLHRAFKQAVRWTLVPRNVSEAIDPPKVQRQEITPLSRDQARALLESAKEDRLEGVYVLAVRSGLRQGEILGLKWDDVDLETGTLQVRRTLSKVRDGEPVFSTPKTAKSRRRIRLSRKTLEVMKAHRSRQAAERLAGTTPWPSNDLVFTTEAGTPLKRHNLKNRSFRTLLERAGLPPSFRFHDLRHTCATILLQAGKHPKYVQELLGHSSISITLDTYSHVMEGMDGGLGDAMDDAI